METKTKLVIAIVQDTDTARIMQALLEAGHRVTQVATTGGFMRRGVDTLMIGVPADQVDEVLDIIRRHVTVGEDETLRHAMIFVLPVEEHVQL